MPPAARLSAVQAVLSVVPAAALSDVSEQNVYTGLLRTLIIKKRP